MSKRTGKIGRLIVMILCAAMVFQMAGIDAMAEGTVSAEVQAYEDLLKGIGQDVVDKLAAKCSSINGVEASMDTILAKAEATYNSIVAATGMNQNLLDELNSYSKYLSDAQGVIDSANKTYALAQNIVANGQASFDQNLEKAQKKEASVTGSEGSALLVQAEAVVSGYHDAIAAAQQKMDRISEIQASAGIAFSQKTVVAYFYILDRGMEIPADIWGRQKDYSTGAAGVLLSGVVTDGQSDYSYLAKYRDEEILYGDVKGYIVTYPTREEINTALSSKGDQLADNETIEWYGITTIGGVIHVDGKIVESTPATPTQPTTPVEPATPTQPTTPVEPVTPTQPTIPADPVTPTQPTTPAEPTTPTQPATPVGENETTDNGGENGNTEEETVVIEEEEVPLNDTVQNDENASLENTVDTVTIEDEETPLTTHQCKMHWLILILVIIYTIMQIIAVYMKNKRIKELEEKVEDIVM